MAKIKIVYGSETGNTESIAEMLKSELEQKGHDVACQSAGDISADDLAEGFDCVLMGVSVWGIDSIELQSEFESLAEGFDKMGLEGKKCAAFASGDTSYEYYCGGVDYIEEQYQNVNATIIVDGLKVEGHASDNKEEIADWANSVHAKL